MDDIGSSERSHHDNHTLALLYLRLSSVTDDSTSMARQERDFCALAERKGWTVVPVLIDEGISGRKACKEPEEAVQRLADDEAAVLAVHSLDRFTRQGWDGLGQLSAALFARERDGRPALFHAVRDGLRSDQAASHLIASVLLPEVARSEAEAAAKCVSNSI